MHPELLASETVTMAVDGFARDCDEASQTVEAGGTINGGELNQSDEVPDVSEASKPGNADEGAGQDKERSLETDEACQNMVENGSSQVGKQMQANETADGAIAVNRVGDEVQSVDAEQSGEGACHITEESMETDVAVQTASEGDAITASEGDAMTGTDQSSGFDETGQIEVQEAMETDEVLQTAGESNQDDQVGNTNVEPVEMGEPVNPEAGGTDDTAEASDIVEPNQFSETTQIVLLTELSHASLLAHVEQQGDNDQSGQTSTIIAEALVGLTQVAPPESETGLQASPSKATTKSTRKKPYPCGQCDKWFEQPSALKLHERVHTGERPYECEECEKKFAQHGNLVRHLRTHSGIKPFKCNGCELAFARKDFLKLHEAKCQGAETTDGTA